MNGLNSLLTLVLVVACCLPGFADKANSAYKRGEQSEARNNTDGAYEAYKEAHQLKPKNAKFMAAFVRLRFYAAMEHIRAGQLLRDGAKLPEALAEFQRAAEIDRSSFVAQQEVRRTTDMIRKQERREESVAKAPQSPLAKIAEEAEGPLELRPLPTTLTNLRMTETSDKVYKVLAKLAGLNVLFDPDFRPQKISVELNDVTPREALNMVALQTKTFWQAASANTILVAADSAGKRKDLQSNVMKTFYLKNVSSPAELQEASNTVRGILDINRVQLLPTQSAVVLRGTPAQMILAEKLFSDIDKPKSEVVIDIAVMQVSRNRVRTMGTNPPTSASIALVPGGGSGSGSSSGGGTLTLNTLANLSAKDFQVSIPGASFSFLMSDSNTKVLQNPEIRALDNQKATLKIGDRVPISTGSFQSGIGGGVNTQFQYLDVGVNIDITPHIHSNEEVTLKMVLEISSVTGSQNIGGINQPIIGQRRIDHETRLRDGEVNLVGGILEESETRSLSGYPWLAKFPILKYLFGQENKDQRENEIIFAITPHIVRALDVTEQNLRLVEVGTGSTVEMRRKELQSDASKSPAPATSPQSNQLPPKETSAGRPGGLALAATPKPQGDRAATNTPSPSLPAQGIPDPCPYGQHALGAQDGIVKCAFD